MFKACFREVVEMSVYQILPLFPAGFLEAFVCCFANRSFVLKW